MEGFNRYLYLSETKVLVEKIHIGRPFGSDNFYAVIEILAGINTRPGAPSQPPKKRLRFLEFILSPGQQLLTDYRRQPDNHPADYLFTDLTTIISQDSQEESKLWVVKENSDILNGNLGLRLLPSLN